MKKVLKFLAIFSIFLMLSNVKAATNGDIMTLSGYGQLDTIDLTSVSEKRINVMSNDSNKYNIAQGMTLALDENGGEHYIAAMTHEDKTYSNSYKTYLYIMDNSFNIQTVVGSYDFGHVNGMTYGNGKLYLTKEDEGDNSKFLQVIDCKFILAAINAANGNATKVNTSFNWNSYLKTYSLNNYYPFISIDKTTGKLYGARYWSKRSNKDGTITDNRADTTFKVYELTENGTSYSARELFEYSAKSEYAGRPGGFLVNNGLVFIVRDFDDSSTKPYLPIGIKLGGTVYQKLIDVIYLENGNSVGWIPIKVPTISKSTNNGTKQVPKYEVESFCLDQSTSNQNFVFYMYDNTTNATNLVYKAKMNNFNTTRIKFTSAGSQGVTGTLYDSSNKAVSGYSGVSTTGSDNIWFRGLTPGTYTFKVTATSSAMNQYKGKSYTFTLTNFDVYYSYIVNGTSENKKDYETISRKNMTIQVNRQDDGTVSNKEDGATVNGAKYGIFSDSACTKKITEITIANGTAKTAKLEPLTYYVKETATSSGYIANTSVMTVTPQGITKNDSTTGNTDNYTITTKVKAKEKVIALQSIAFVNAPNAMNKDTSVNLTISYNPENTTQSKTYTISSSDTSTIAVNGTTITAKKPGKATITATCNGKTTSKEITVLSPLQSITFTNVPTNMTEGDSINITISYNPNDTTDSRNYTITSSDTSVIAVNGTTITALKAGKATITANCNGKTVSQEITINSKDIPLQSIEIKTNISEIIIGKLIKIELKYNPDNTTESKNFTITSDNESIIAVNGDTIQGLKEGKTTITVTTETGKTVSKEVTVIKEPEFLKGDLDRNRVVDANDASIALELYKAENATEEDIMIGDMDENGLIDANDASMILETYKINN